VATFAIAVIGSSVALVASRMGRRSAAGAGVVPSVLALPCTVHGASEFAYLADAVPGTVSTLLGRIEGIDTRVPPTQLEMERLGGDLTRIADAYRVEKLIVSSIVVQGADLLFNVQVVDARSRKVVWSDQYEGTRENYNELTRRATEGIRRAIRPEAAAVASSAGLAAVSDAELSFRRGKYFSNRYSNLHEPADFDLALASFRRGLELDPSLAEAAGEVAMLYVYRFESGTMPARETVPAIEAWASRAVAIDPCSVRGWSARTAVEQQRPKQDTRKMVEYGLKAASCGPNDGRAQFFLGFGADPAGLTSIALTAYVESHRLDPLYVYAPLNAAILLRVLGRPEEALRILDEGRKVEPDMPLLQLERALDLTELKRPAEAESTLEPLEARAATDPLLGALTPMVRAALALEEGDRPTSDAAVQRVLSLVQDPATTGLLAGIAAYYVAPALARHGRAKQAVDILERAMRLGAPPPYEILTRNRDLASLRDDPRLSLIVARSKIQFAEALDVLEQAQSRGELPAYLREPLAALVRQLGEPGRRADRGEAPRTPLPSNRRSDAGSIDPRAPWFL
jgi:tetratricopeptide (TPR) repeat protein